MTHPKKKRANPPSRLGRFLALLPAGCVLLYPLYLATRLDLVQHTYTTPSLPAVFDGLKIVYVSDIHYGTFFKKERLDQLVEKVNALDADIILLGGDYAEDSRGALEFWQMKPDFRAKTATLCVFGNHDRTLPEENFLPIQDAMKAAGVIPLVNDVYVLEKDGHTLAFAGPDDYYNGYPDLEKLARLTRSADFTVFLPHTPDILPQAYQLPDGAFYQLALCGHTHGGQVAFFGYAPKSSSDYGNRYRSGWYHEEGTDILVSNGVGTSDLPVRLGVQPQYHLITLQAE